MNILVTGGAGYIGSILVPRLLAAGHRVRVIDALMFGGHSLLGVWSHKNFEFIRGDIRDWSRHRIWLEGMEAVIHLAAIVGDPACAADPDRAKSTNLDSSINLLKESSILGVGRFLFASTCSNYGKMADPEQLVDETSELAPISLYAETKVAVEMQALGEEWGGLEPIVLRLSTVYGVSSRMRFDLTVNEFTLEMLTKKYIVIFGEQFWRPYVHVTDVAWAIQIALESTTENVAGEVFNVGSTDQNFRKQDLVKMILHHASDADIEYVHRDEDPRDYRVSFEKIRLVLGFEKMMSVPDGIREVVDLVRAGVIEDYNLPEFRNV